MPRRLFGTNGIRGVANRDLTPEFAVRVGLSIGTFFQGGRILLGCDGRVSSPFLKSAVAGALLSTGCEAHDAGMVPTPALQYGVGHLGMDGGVMITASHNPPEYNGIKVMAADGVEIDRGREREVEEIFFEGRFKRAEWNRVGELRERTEVLEVYREAILGQVDVGLIQGAGLHVAVDPGNGVTALIVPQILRDLGCGVVTVNADIDGRFPGRSPEPRPDNLSGLSTLVRASGADLGVAFDGDGDRAIFVDERGRVHWGDRSFALIAREFLAEHPGEAVVTPVSSSQVVRDVVEAYGGRVVWTRVGSVDVSRKMLSEDLKLGGEENGGVMYGPHQPVRDGAMTTALILEILARTGKRLSELFDELPRYRQMKDRVECPEELKGRVLEELRSVVEGPRVETLDGVKIWYPDSSWILVRPSGTEPIFRLYAEAKTEERVRELMEEFKKLLEEMVSRV
ncbi:phosphoglucosamine mutase [Candidatus Bathyarchaeota archaeon]|nr:MAG: phosphoglucosamine mutase [Candidatus Bathyarchaeota archaeon]